MAKSEGTELNSSHVHTEATATHGAFPSEGNPESSLVTPKEGMSDTAETNTRDCTSGY